MRLFRLELKRILKSRRTLILLAMEPEHPRPAARVHNDGGPPVHERPKPEQP